VANDPPLAAIDQVDHPDVAVAVVGSARENKPSVEKVGPV